MNEKYIVEGPALAKLLRENRIRVARGELTFTPLVDVDEKKAEPVVVDDKDNKDIPEEDTKEVAPEEEKKTAPKKSKK